MGFLSIWAMGIWAYGSYTAHMYAAHMAHIRLICTVLYRDRVLISSEDTPLHNASGEDDLSGAGLGMHSFTAPDRANAVVRSPTTKKESKKRRN